MTSAAPETAMTHQMTDTHVHLFDRAVAGLIYGWLEERDGEAPGEPSVAAIASDRYWPEDFIAETRFHDVGRVIHVAAALDSPDPVDETAWVQACADRTGVPHGIVVAQDLTSPSLEHNLERHREHTLVCGVRDIREDDFLRDPRWLSGVDHVAHSGLVLTVDCPPERLPDVRALAERLPALTVCLNHAAAPETRDREAFAAWRTHIDDVARADNVVVKISGLPMFDWQWADASLEPWVLGCIEAFGPDRAFFGTNWPVDRMASGYGDLVTAYRRIVSGFTDSEQQALFSATADRVFHLSVPQGERASRSALAS